MDKHVCIRCGYIYEGVTPPSKCPICHENSTIFPIKKESVKATELKKIDEEDYEIIKIIESDGIKKAIDWYQENYDCDWNEAKDAIIQISDKYGVYNLGEDNVESVVQNTSAGSGCMITILIAITSTLSVFFMV